MATKKTAQKRTSKAASRPNPHHARATKLEAIGRYAVSGNAAEVARDMEVAERTVRTWVSGALSGDDKEGAEVLAETGRALRARLLDQTERALGRGIEKAAERIASDSWAEQFKGDPTPQYITAMGQVYGRLLDADRLAAEREGKLPIVGARIIFETQSTDDDEAPPEAP